MLPAIPMLVLVAAGCGAGEQGGPRLKPGTYAGSTSASRPIVIEIGGGGLKIDTHSTTRRENGVFVEEKRPRRTLRCKHQESRDRIVELELVCDVTSRDGRTETIELMQL